MLKIGCLLLTAVLVAPLWSQVEPSASGGDYTADDESRMITPPPVSGQVYPTRFGAERPQNHLAAGLVFTAAYVDNLLVGNTPTSDETYSVLPTFSLERDTHRQRQVISYGAGFTLYQHTSSLNSVAQNASVNYQYHFTKYASINIQDSFNQNTNAFNQPNPFSNAGVPGGIPAGSPALVNPYGNQIANTTSAGLAYQYGRNAMIGGGGSYSFVHYQDVEQYTDINNSNAVGGTFFYTRRLTPRQYLGGIYRFAEIQTNPVDSTTTTNAIYGFYTLFLNHMFTLSFQGGPQHFNASQPPNPDVAAWTPSFNGSIAYRTQRVNIAASYARVVTGGGGLVGAYHSNEGNLSAGRLFTRTWSAGVSGSYYNFNSATPIFTPLNEGGHSWAVNVSVQHTFREFLNAEAGYGHFHQSYTGITSVSSMPDSNRAYFSISYKYTRPLGR